MPDHLQEHHSGVTVDDAFTATFAVSLDERIRLKVEKGKVGKGTRQKAVGSTVGGDGRQSSRKRKQHPDDGPVDQGGNATKKHRPT